MVEKLKGMFKVKGEWERNFEKQYNNVLLRSSEEEIYDKACDYIGTGKKRYDEFFKDFNNIGNSAGSIEKQESFIAEWLGAMGELLQKYVKYDSLPPDVKQTKKLDDIHVSSYLIRDEWIKVKDSFVEATNQRLKHFEITKGCRVKLKSNETEKGLIQIRDEMLVMCKNQNNIQYINFQTPSAIMRVILTNHYCDMQNWKDNPVSLFNYEMDDIIKNINEITFMSFNLMQQRLNLLSEAV